MFVWNLEEGRVTEQMVVTIPATPGNVFPGLNVQSKYGTHTGRGDHGYLGMAGSQSMKCQKQAKGPLANMFSWHFYYFLRATTV